MEIGTSARNKNLKVLNEVLVSETAITLTSGRSTTRSMIRKLCRHFVRQLNGSLVSPSCTRLTSQQVKWANLAVESPYISEDFQ